MMSEHLPARVQLLTSSCLLYQTSFSWTCFPSPFLSLSWLFSVQLAADTKSASKAFDLPLWSALLFVLSSSSWSTDVLLVSDVYTRMFLPCCKNCWLKIGSTFGLLDSNLLESSPIVDMLFPSSGSLRRWKSKPAR